MRAGAVSSTANELLIEEIRSRVRQLTETKDLQGLASVAEICLDELRMLCERPFTCSELGEMIDTLERLNLDEREMAEE